ncbi:MAG: DsbA family protein [Gammaproteobacteria bacterium]|nr:DsbA family protein [Gammaproteobacteria bacterium]
MSVKRKLQSRLLSAYISSDVRAKQRAWHETRRKLAGNPHIVSVFLQLDDPYSWLLSNYLAALVEHYDIELRVFLSAALGDAYRPAPEMFAEYAELDCSRVAAELGLPFLDQGAAPPVEHRRRMLGSLAAAANDENFLDTFCDALQAYWRGDAEAAARLAAADAADADDCIAKSQAELRKLGHYNSAMLHYGGEWYWGVDRLHFLTERLDELGVARGAGRSARLASIGQAMQMELPFKPPAAAKDLPPLELFYSFRSPYSQLCLGRAYDLADAFGLELVLRPVLPMMMRGMQVPDAKIRYIVRDAMREAEACGVPFGDCMDPLGEGVERCHAVFAYAKSEKRGREFLQNAAEMIWGQAVDAATDKGLRKITGKTGLFWPDVKQALSNDDWRDTAEENRQLMFSLGCWGVPTLCVGDFAVWGQDRVWLLARHVEDLCDTGEGILV